jgi:5-methyltetrahydropteroyltriglutamate--homocysteine methyltransferase
MFTPYHLELETELDGELYSWLAFARQKLDELVLLKQAVNHGIDAVAGPFLLNRAAVEGRRNSERTHNPQVRARLAAVDESMVRRKSDFETCKGKQAQRLSLPLLPTTIGSFHRP